MSTIASEESLRQLAEHMRDGDWLRVTTVDFVLDHAQVVEFRCRLKADAVVLRNMDADSHECEYVVDVEDIERLQKLRR